MSFICGDCKREHFVPTRDEDREGQPCVEALARERDILRAALQNIAGSCECIDRSKCPGCVAKAALESRDSK